jgi:hypothetical protein
VTQPCGQFRPTLHPFYESLSSRLLVHRALTKSTLFDLHLPYGVSPEERTVIGLSPLQLRSTPHLSETLVG